VYAKGEYDLWLLDSFNERAVQNWRGGAVDPSKANANVALVRVNVARTPESPSLDGKVDCLSISTMETMKYLPEECLAPDVWRTLKVPAKVAVIKEKWDAIPLELRPLPPLAALPNRRDQDYRLCVVARRGASGVVRYYMGFHVEVITAGTQPVVRFYNWEDRMLGAEQIDLSGDVIDPPSNGHTTIGASGTPKVGERGALFVDIESFADVLPFLSGPKVPFGGETDGSRRGAVQASTSSSLLPRAVQREPPAVVVSDGQDAWLEAVRAKITTEKKLMHNEASAMEALISWFTADPGRDEIELISHANDRHLLTVGAWRLGAGTFQGASEELRRNLRGKTLRIVGCATAHGHHARQALCFLQQEFQLTVYGAVGLIGTADLISTGTDPRQRAESFIAPICAAGPAASTDDEEYVVQQVDLERGGRREPFGSTEQELVFGGLPDATWNKLRDTGALLLKHSYFAYPGLLQLPSATWSYEVGGPRAGTLRADALFRGQVLRLVRSAPGVDRREYLFLLSDPDERARFAAAFGFQYQ
jgi:hypothetical protein